MVHTPWHVPLRRAAQRTMVIIMSRTSSAIKFELVIVSITYTAPRRTTTTPLADAAQHDRRAATHPQSSAA